MTRTTKSINTMRECYRTHTFRSLAASWLIFSLLNFIRMACTLLVHFDNTHGVAEKVFTFRARYVFLLVSLVQVVISRCVRTLKILNTERKLYTNDWWRCTPNHGCFDNILWLTCERFKSLQYKSETTTDVIVCEHSSSMLLCYFTFRHHFTEWTSAVPPWPSALKILAKHTYTRCNV